MKKPVLYIDVDGVLFGEYCDNFQLRPNVMGFLQWCIEHFDCRWLTCWSHDQLESLFHRIYADKVFKAIKYVRWSRHGFNDKTVGIDFNADWYWIDDDLFPEEQMVLTYHRCLDRHIRVNPNGEYELQVVQAKLREILNSKINK